MNEAARQEDPTSMAKEIADWCQTRANELRVESARQFKLIVMIVMAGLVLLLILPPLIGQIDFMTTRLFGGAPPIESLKNAEDAVRLLDAQVKESEGFLDTLDRDLESIRATLDKHAGKRATLVDEAKSSLTTPLALWQLQTSFEDNRLTTGAMDETSLYLYRFVLTPSGALLAGGYEEDGRNRFLLILRSNDGRTWDTVRPENAEGERIEGSLHDLAVTTNGRVLATGIERNGDKIHPLILHSNDGRTWDTVRPEDAKGERIEGWFAGTTATSIGTILIAGYEKDGDSDYTFILHYNQGTWDHIRPEDANGERIEGRLIDIAVTPDGAVLATGIDESRGSTHPLILRSDDRRTWYPVRPPNDNGKRIEGWLNGIMVTPNGRLLAAGLRRGGNRGSSLLLLRSNDGRTWDPVPLENADGNRIDGQLHDLTVTPSGALLAVGSEYTIGGEHLLILSSNDGQAWAPIRLESADGTRIKGVFSNLTATPDGSVYGAGTGIWKSHLDGEFEREWQDWPRTGSWRENAKHVEQELEGLIATLSRRGQGYPEGTAELRKTATETLDAWTRDRASEGRMAARHDDENSALTQQKDTLMKMQVSTDQLEKTLTDADELRRASRIATRIAVVALLIYLVQIVVNRYRYLQRMEGFYRARAQALRLLIAMPEKAESLFKNITVTDLMLALSPDGIGFDKSADPPTQNMMNMFREALRRDRGA